MSSSPSSQEGSSAPRSRNRKRRRRTGPGGGQPGQSQPQSYNQGAPRERRPENAEAGPARRRYNKPAPKPESTVEKVIRFLTFGIVDSRQKMPPRLAERTPIKSPEVRRENDRPANRDSERSGGRNRDRDRERGPRDPNRTREPREERAPREPREPREPRQRDRERTEPVSADARKEERRERKPPEPVEPTTERLHVGNLAYEVTEADLYDLFNGVGAVRDAEIVYHKYTQRSKGFAFVVMASVEEAKRAFQVLNGKEFMGRPMWVNGAKSAGPAEGEEEEQPASVS